MRVRLIYNHIPHHALRSGYDQLARFVHAEAYRPGLAARLGGMLPERWLSWLPTSDLADWYIDGALSRELDICARMALPSRTLYHFFYAENDLRFSSLFRPRFNNKVVATFHQPPAFLERHFSDTAHIRRLDAAVVVSRFQVPFLQRYLRPERVFHVPHGIDTEYWCPADEPDRWEVPTFLLVGFWLRDLDLAREVIRRAGASGPDMRFRVVIKEERRGAFEGLPNTQLLSAIPDDALRDEYRKASALFLPLQESTANNAILEALSCGTPVVTSRIGGVPEYVDEECAVLLPSGGVEQALETLQGLARDPEQAARMGRAARRRAEAFSWVRVGEQMDACYRQVLGPA